MRLSAIVVAFGKEALLDECLTSVEAALAKVEGESELVVVVNELGATGRARLAARPGPVAVVEGGTSLGFAAGVAKGLEVARGTWIALVNDDCLLEPDALRQLLIVAERSPTIGAVAAQIRFAHEPGTVNSAGIELDELGIARERLIGEPVAAVGADPVEVLGASGAFGLYRRAMLDSVGGLDASFFAYLEDVDLAWRARMSGWRCLLAPDAVAFHHHSATLGHGSSAKHLLVGRNRVRMLAKNASARQLRGRLVRIVGYDAAYVAYAAATGHTLAPLEGRLRGLAEWRRYRAAGRPGRRELELPPSPGLRDALRRNRVYRSVAGGPP
jgi:GT2 family glycosyltransferase